MKNESALPVAVIGAGPIGLAAAANLLERGIEVLVFESSASIAAHFDSFRHVQLFSPWRYNIDPAARRMLEAAGWKEPALDQLPTAGAMIDEYLAPLAALPRVKAALHLSHRVLDVARVGFDKVKSTGREDAPFAIRCNTNDGIREYRASAVIDASGTWGKPNPLGANGLPTIGEHEAAAQIAYGMPDILGRDRARYAGKRVLVAGAGHSAAGDLLNLAKLAEEAPGTQIVWTIRGHNFTRIFGGGENDGLPARGALGKRLKALSEGGRLELQAGFRAEEVRRMDGKLTVIGHGVDGAERSIDGLDELIVAAGGRPDLALTSELRLKLDSWLESTEQLAPLIDPNVHSCGTVRPHGHRELAHPEARFYMVGAKSYGRAPNFLLATGHEQVRSVVAALAGDLAAADDVRLELPETGVCSTQFDEASSGCCGASEAEPVSITTPAAAASCCGGPSVKRADACCATDEVIKESGGGGLWLGGVKGEGRRELMPLSGFITALGIAQIISWGSLFYSIGVLGAAMRKDLGMSELFLFGSFTAGLLVSGTLAPLMGRLIDRRGGRFVLSLGSVLAFLAMSVLAIAPNREVMVIGWLLAGAAMAACLYDPAFATLSQHLGTRYRKGVTALTLFGGFASTAFWPLSLLLMEAWGWRVTFGIYAAIHLFINLPIHLHFVPRFSHLMRAERAKSTEPSPAMKDPRLFWLTLSFAMATFIFGVVAVHLVPLLTEAGLTQAQAVTVSMLVGPMQVAGRIVELGIAPRVKAVTIGFASFALMTLCLVALISVQGFGIAAIVFVTAYGFGNGMLTIVKGTAPVELFGSQGLGGLLGYMSRAGMYAKAIAPASFSALVTFGLTRNAALASMAALSIAGMGSYAMATRKRHTTQA